MTKWSTNICETNGIKLHYTRTGENYLDWGNTVVCLIITIALVLPYIVSMQRVAQNK